MTVPKSKRFWIAAGILATLVIVALVLSGGVGLTPMVSMLHAHPQSIYEKPASLFVAGFVGSPAMNFLQGRLDHAGRLQVGDVGIDTSGYGFEDSSRERDVVLGIRSEDISVVDQGTPESIPGTLAFTELLGADALGWFECLGKRFSVRLGVNEARAMHPDVGLCFNMTKASFFSAASERRI